MEINDQFLPGSIGEITAMHGRYYAQHWGFGTYFESKVASEIAAFASRQSEDDLVLIARDADGVAASLILDLNDPASDNRGAHLRWFIADERTRGSGLGRKLMTRAMAHTDEYKKGKAWLTTFAGLDPARRLYESFGFALAIENEGNAWGTKVTEQEFRR